MCYVHYCGVSIPLRYADNFVSPCFYLRIGLVSIPLRYADNDDHTGQRLTLNVFQFLLGTLITLYV